MLGTTPRPIRFAVLGAALLGTLGAIGGLVIGLTAYAPTAPFAALELGVPASLAGGIIGFAAGGVVMLILGAAHLLRRRD